MRKRPTAANDGFDEWVGYVNQIKLPKESNQFVFVCREVIWKLKSPNWKNNLLKMH